MEDLLVNFLEGRESSLEPEEQSFLVWNLRHNARYLEEQNIPLIEIFLNAYYIRHYEYFSACGETIDLALYCLKTFYFTLHASHSAELMVWNVSKTVVSCMRITC